MFPLGEQFPVLEKHGDSEQTASCRLRSQRTEFGAVRVQAMRNKILKGGSYRRGNGKSIYKLSSNPWLIPELYEWRDSKDIKGK